MVVDIEVSIQNALKSVSLSILSYENKLGIYVKKGQKFAAAFGRGNITHTTVKFITFGELYWYCLKVNHHSAFDLITLSLGAIFIYHCLVRED